MFDNDPPQGPGDETPEVVHHYTSWAGAEGILKTQRFWATDHRCTNDTAELVTADGIIMEVARELRSRSHGTAAAALNRFVQQFPRKHIHESVIVCLVCFSLSRDDEEQWRRYGDNGRGICLSLRVLNEPRPENQRSRILKVDYSESSLREAARTEFRRIVEALSRYPPIQQNIGLGAGALNRMAAFLCMSAKKPEWAVEKEFRYVTLIEPGSGIELKQRQTAGGTKLYLPVLARAEGKRIALAEILIGPNCDAEATHRVLIRLLSECGYQVGGDEYPVIGQSRLPPWASTPE